TIYVPDELKAKMDSFDSEGPNWSGIAQAAFQSECDRMHNRKKGAGKMNAVIQRLRASKIKVEDQEHAAGLAAGRKWAMEDAEYDELARVVEWHEGFVPGSAWDAPFGAGGWLFGKIENDGTPLEDDVDSFWEQFTGVAREPEESFVSGFA